MLTGKGFFIWKIPYCEGGNVFSIVEQAVQLQLSHVLIKAVNGGYFYNVVNGRDLVPDLVTALRDAGIQVWLWQYVFGDNPASEAIAAIERIQQLQPDGFVVNAEVEYKNRPNQATAYMKALRAGVGNDLLIALSTYRWPSFHPEFPFTQFMEKCDFGMPQVYWMQAHNPRSQLVRTLTEYKQFNKPVFPTGACFREHGWQPTATDVSEFLQACKDLSLQGCNFWEWGTARLYVQDGWEVIRSTAWANTPGIPPAPIPVPDGLRARVLVDGLNVRSGPGTGYPAVGKLQAGSLVNIRGLAGSDTWVEIMPGQWAAFRYGGRSYMELV